MPSKRRALNRPLSAILGRDDGGSDSINEALTHLPIEQLAPGRFQPRQDMSSEALAELAQSIRSQGVLQPVIVRRLEGSQRFEIVAGERRWRAAQLAGLLEIPVLIRILDDAAALQVALIENLQRKDLNPLEEAGALRQLINEFEMTHEAVAEQVGRSRAAVSNLLRLLDLGPEAQALLRTGQLEMGHARALLALTGARQAQAARLIHERGLSVRETERYLAGLKGKSSHRSRALRKPNPDQARLERSLGEVLGRAVAIVPPKRGQTRGRLVIHYDGLDDFDALLARLGYEDGA